MQSISSTTTKKSTITENCLEAEGEKKKANKSTVAGSTFDWSPEASPTLKSKSEQVLPKETVSNGEIITLYDDFEKMDLQEKVLRGVYAYGLEKPSAIQQRAIIPCIQGRDVVAQSQSGTGKTATFTIAMLQRIDITKKHCQVL